jgi:hypothetical protein
MRVQQFKEMTGDQLNEKADEHTERRHTKNLNTALVQHQVLPSTHLDGLRVNQGPKHKILPIASTSSAQCNRLAQISPQRN